MTSSEELTSWIAEKWMSQSKVLLVSAVREAVDNAIGAAVAEEREACAKVAEVVAAGIGFPNKTFAATIRARGNGGHFFCAMCGERHVTIEALDLCRCKYKTGPVTGSVEGKDAVPGRAEGPAS